MTKKKMDALGIPYEEVDMAANPGAADEARSLGYRSAPIVITEDNHWSGFRPDLINSLTLVPA